METSIELGVITWSVKGLQQIDFGYGFSFCLIVLSSGGNSIYPIYPISIPYRIFVILKYLVDISCPLFGLLLM